MESFVKNKFVVLFALIVLSGSIKINCQGGFESNLTGGQESSRMIYFTNNSSRELTLTLYYTSTGVGIGVGRMTQIPPELFLLRPGDERVPFDLNADQAYSDAASIRLESTTGNLGDRPQGFFVPPVRADRPLPIRPFATAPIVNNGQLFIVRDDDSAFGQLSIA